MERGNGLLAGSWESGVRRESGKLMVLLFTTSGLWPLLQPPLGSSLRSQPGAIARRPFCRCCPAFTDHLFH